jgi:transcriptional regulator with XRE-family HTH domain
MSKVKSQKVSTQSPELIELITIKRLLIFALLRSGASQRDVAAALGVDQSFISRLFAGGAPKPARSSVKVK